MNLTLALPALNWGDETSLPPLDVPALNQLLRFGRFSAAPQSSAAFFADYLWQGSLLALAKQALSIPAEQPAVFASPVWQQMGMHRMSMLGGSEIGISAEEAAELCGGLNQFYADEGWRFQVYRPDLWLLCLPETADWQAEPVLDVLGEVDGTMRAQGDGSRAWLSAQTEIQMWLHNHALNAARTAAGQPAINGVWLWRDGVGTTANTPLLASDSAWADAYSGSRVDAPYDYAAWYAIAAEQGSDSGVIFLDDLLPAAHTADVWAYQQTLQAWDERFFAPIWQDLRSGRLKQFTLATDGAEGGRLQLSAKAGRAFWKRQRAFQGKLGG